MEKTPLYSINSTITHQLKSHNVVTQGLCCYSSGLIMYYLEIMTFQINYLFLQSYCSCLHPFIKVYLPYGYNHPLVSWYTKY